MDVRKTPDAMVFALVTAQNARLLAEAQADFPHLRKLTAANATNEATSVTLVNQIKSVFNRHVVDSVAHDAELSDAVATADATNAATAITLANAMKTAFNAHGEATDVHFNDDTVNVVTNANATDQTTLNTLVNEIKGDLNAHVAAAPLGPYLHLVDA
jgi:beta-galactosidase GanA